MNAWIKRIHMYLGLLNFTILIVFGIVGLSRSFGVGGEGAQTERTVTYVDYVAPGEMTDREIADDAYRHLGLPLTQPAPDWSLRRDKENNLRFRLPTVAKVHDVVVLESVSRLRVTTSPVDVWSYAFRLHEMTAKSHRDWRVRLWAYYIELSIWSLIFMALSGVYLWVASRPKLRWAQVTFAAGIVSFLALWVVTR